MVRAESRAGWTQEEAARTVDGSRLGAGRAYKEMKPPYSELARVLKNRGQPRVTPSYERKVRLEHVIVGR